MSSEFKKWALILVVVGFLFWNPFTRQIILFILPMGSGIDDLIFVGAFVIAGIFWLISKAKEKRREEN